MKNKRSAYTIFQKFSAIIMVLLWIAISSSLFVSFQKMVQKGKQTNCSIPITGTEEESSNPFGNNTEEKTPKSSNSFSEDFLHNQNLTEPLFVLSLRYFIIKNAGTYIAFHGEHLVPPPDIV
jgi:hypothetical protein